MPRWEHEVRVRTLGRDVMLTCRCAWSSEPMRRPTVSSLAQRAQDHRREADTEPERCTYRWADERCPMPANHTGRHIFDDDQIRSRSR